MKIEFIKYSYFRIWYLFIILISGCGYSFNAPFLMPIIPNEELLQPTKLRGEIYLQEVGDLRQKRSFLTYEDSVFTADADVGPMVRESLSNTMLSHGIRFSKKASYIYKVDITKWEAEYSGSLLLNVKASTEMQLSVYNRSGKRIYVGKYLGEANLEQLSHDNESVLNVLGLAMRAAINKLVFDPGLNKLVASGKVN